MGRKVYPEYLSLSQSTYVTMKQKLLSWKYHVFVSVKNVVDHKEKSAVMYLRFEWKLLLNVSI